MIRVSSAEIIAHLYTTGPGYITIIRVHYTGLYYR